MVSSHFPMGKPLTFLGQHGVPGLAAAPLAAPLRAQTAAAPGADAARPGAAAEALQQRTRGVERTALANCQV